MDAASGSISSRSVERAILRLLGVGGTGPANTPVPDLFLARLGAERLAFGAARTLGALVAATGRTPDDVASAVADGSLDVAAGSDVGDDAARDALARTVARVFVSFDVASETRQRSFGGAPATIVLPARRTIVRAENVREDRIAALTAIEAGVRGVIYVMPDAEAPRESTWYDATLDHVRMLRESLDAMADRVRAYIVLEVYASAPCAPEIAVLAALERVDVLSGIARCGLESRFTRMLARRAGVMIDASAVPVNVPVTDPETFAVSAGYWNPFARGFRSACEDP